jgi:hypothetical protein
MPDDNEVGVHLLAEAASLIDQGRFQESAETFRRVTTIPGLEAEGHVGLGNLLLNQNYLEAAEAEFRLALQFDQQHVGALCGLGQVSEAWSTSTSNPDSYAELVDSAIGYYKAARLIDPDMQFASDRLAELLSKSEEIESTKLSSQEGEDSTGEETSDGGHPSFWARQDFVILGTVGLLALILIAGWIWNVNASKSAPKPQMGISLPDHPSACEIVATSSEWTVPGYAEVSIDGRRVGNFRYGLNGSTSVTFPCTSGQHQFRFLVVTKGRQMNCSGLVNFYEGARVAPSIQISGTGQATCGLR